jgi:phage shock protein PspC (stress-responsive transcriptional regulator)
MDHRQLTRSETNKRIAGVCGGIAEYFDIDPTLVRIAFIVAALIGGPGIIAYIVLWIVLPRGEPAPAGSPPPSGYGFTRTPPAVHIAEERFARGEITAEDLAQIRADLIGGG